MHLGQVGFLQLGSDTGVLHQVESGLDRWFTDDGDAHNDWSYRQAFLKRTQAAGKVYLWASSRLQPTISIPSDTRERASSSTGPAARAP